MLEAYEASCREHGHEPGMTQLPPDDAATTQFVADDVDKAWDEVGEYILHDVKMYGEWNPGVETASISHAQTVDELRATSPNHKIYSTEEATEIVRSGMPLMLMPLCGGTPTGDRVAVPRARGQRGPAAQPDARASDVASVARFPDTSDPDAIVAALARRRRGAGRLVHLAGDGRGDPRRGRRAVEAAESGMRTVNPAVQAFYGPYTKHVSALAAVSPTFADEVIAHPTYAAICDAILLPSCSRYQLNLGHLIARGPGAEAQFPHRDEDVWPHFPRPHDELQIASLVALTDFRVDTGATRVVPGSHRWERGRLRSPTSRRRGGATRRRGDLPRLHHPLRGHQLDHRRVASRRARELHPRLAPHRGEQLAGGATVGGQEAVTGAPRSCSVTRCTTPSPTAAATWAWSACVTRWSSSPTASSER